MAVHGAHRTPALSDVGDLCDCTWTSILVASAREVTWSAGR